MYRAPIETLRSSSRLRSPGRRLTLWVAGSVLAGTCALPAPSQAASLIGPTNAADAFSSASRFYSHYANGYFWVAYHNGTTGPVIASSPDGVAWTAQGLIFSGANPSSAGQWAARFSGNVIIAFGTNPSNPRRRWYRNASLNANGTVTWNAADDQAATGNVNLEVNSLIANTKPVLWFAGSTAAGEEAIGSQLNLPVWTSPAATPPSLAGASGGGFSAGAIFPTGGVDPGDYIVLRATTRAPYAAGSHRLLADRFDASVPAYVSGTNWYDVSRNGLPPAGPFQYPESAVTEVKEGTDAQAHVRLAAVRDSSGNIHAVYVNRLDDVVHYKKDVGFNDSWSRVSTDVTQSAASIDRVALTGSPLGSNLLLFYSKSDGGIYYRRFDGAAWGAETTLRSASPVPLQGALAPLESASGCAEGVAWVEGAATPYNVMFATLAGGGCVGPAANTFTFETPDVKMVWDSGPNSGGGLSEFYAKNEPSAAMNRVGDVGYNLFSTQLTDASFNWRFEGFDTFGGGRSGTLYVLETTPSRARVRQQYDYTAAIHLDRDWTAYAYPRVAIDETLVFDSVQNIRGAQGIHAKGETTCGGPNTFYCGGKSDEPNRIWVTTDNAATYSDMLAIPYTTPFFGRAGTGYVWELAPETGTPNTFFARVWESGLVPAGPGSNNRFYLFYPHLTGLTSTGAEWQPYAAEYRTPDALTITTGSPWQDAAEHTTGDNFNEAENAYTLTLDPVLGLSFDIDGLTTNRKRPFFKMRQWRSLQPPATITREGTTLIRDVHYTADVKPISRGYFCSPACTDLANGGLVGDPNERLNDPATAQNFALNFTGANTLYLGSDAKFRGLNVGLATLGSGTATLQWQYWNGSTWTSLQAVAGFLDETSHLKMNGSIHWGADPAGWTPTQVSGGLALYYIRATLASGSYSTFPTERLIRTDILLFQYLSDVTLDGQTFVLTPPAATTHYRSIGTALDYALGTVSATNGSTIVTGAGTAWVTANRGRGDRIRIAGVDYTIAGVDSQTQLRLTESYAGATGVGKIYSIARKFASLADWESCIDGTAPAPVAPCEGVASGSFPLDNRSEVGIAYKESALAGVVIDGSTTDATHTITLTADLGNRHSGIAGSGVVVDNGANPSTAVEVGDDFVTIEWLEIKGGGAGTADGIDVDLLSGGATANQVVLRQNLVHGVPGDGIEIDDGDTILDAYNNVVYGNGGHGIRVDLLSPLTVNGRLRILNNTLFANTQGGVFKVPDASAPTVLLRNNIAHSHGAPGDFSVDALDPASSDNLSSDLTATAHSPAGGGIPSAGSADALFKTITVGSEDLHLETSGAAVDQGVDLSGIFSEDIDGTMRMPLWEIGADDTMTGLAVYYSVGTSFPADLKGGAPTISIAAGTATFSVPQPDNVGVGDEILYNGTTRAYILGRTTSTVYTVSTATGTTPANVAGAPVNSIRRAFGSLTTAVANSADAAHLTNPDLVATNRQLHWALYNDGPMNDGLVNINGYTTGPNNYIRIFTPLAPSQVGSRQRHSGRRGTGFRLAPVNAAPPTPYEAIRINDEHVRIEGIEIDMSQVTGGLNVAGMRTDQTLTPAADIRFDKVLVHDVTNAVTGGVSGDLACINFGQGVTRVSNSVCYGVHNFNSNAATEVYGFRAGSIHSAALYFHNNTIFDIESLVAGPGNVSGINIGSTGPTTVRNMAVLDVTRVGGGSLSCFGGFLTTTSNNVSSDATASGPGSQINKTAYASYFASIVSGSEDLHLQGDSAALWGSSGADLDADANLPVVDDVDGEPRHASLPDIGADEAIPTADLAITKTDGQTTEVRESPVTYTITVTNLGPFAVTGATVTDSLPASLTGATWSCSASAGSSCTPSGSGNILDAVNLLVGGTATYTLTATITAAAPSPLDNTATVSPPGGIADPNSVNNSSLDSDALLPAQSDVQVLKSGPATAVLGETIVYSVTARNNGPSNANGVTLIDNLPPEVVFLSSVPAGPSCSYDAGLRRLTCTVGTLAAGSTFPVSISVRVANGSSITNAASVSSTNPPDPVPGNNSVTALTSVVADVCSGSGPSTWWNNAWARRRKITFNNSGQPQALVNFPVLVVLDSSRIDYGRTQNAGQDLRFVDDNDTLLLDHEIERWDEGGNTYVWVRVPQINASSTTDFIWMYYDNPAASALPPTAAENTWDAGFRMVQHLEESSPSPHLDSTAFNTDSSFISVGLTPPQGAAAGQIDGTDSFVRASNTRIEVVDNGSLDMAAGDSFTIEAWVRSSFTGSYQMAFSKESRGAPTDGEIQLWTNFGGEASFWLNDGAGNTARADSLTNVADDAWHYLVGRWTAAGGTAEIFVDGVIVGSDFGTLGAIATSTPGVIGDEGDASGPGGSGQASWDGLLDEIRVSKVARANTWIRAQNLSMRDTFNTFGGEVSGRTCHLRSIGTRVNYGTVELEGSGTMVSGTPGSTTVDGLGTTWRSANRGRGDRIRIGGTDYTIASVDSETQLTLTAPYAGAPGPNSYWIERKFATLADWESCVDGMAPLPPRPCEGVASDSLVTDNRAEVGVAYADTGYFGYPFSGGLVIDGRPDNLNTDATHTLTLTADEVDNRHHGRPVTGVLVDNTGGSTPAVQILDNFVTVEWLEITNGAGAADGVAVNGLSPTNRVVIANNLIHGVPGDGIELGDLNVVADVYNNIVHGNAGLGIKVSPLLVNGAIRLLNNTVYNDVLGGIAGPGTYPTVLLRNNISVGNLGSGDFSVPGFDPASGHNLGSDGSGVSHSQAGTGVDSSVALVNFASTATGDLHIVSPSTAQNAGTTLSTLFTGDIDAGTRTPVWDIGADEFGAPSADLGINKDDFQPTEVPGTPVTYTIVVTNAGPSVATGATVTDTLSASLSGATWSCTASPGSSCTASGSGNILDTVTLLVGGTATYTLTANIALGAPSPLVNTATVTPPAGFIDPNSVNDSSTDQDTLATEADVVITKQASPNPVPAGANLTYTLTVTNLGPSNTTNVQVTDTLPAGVVFQSATPPCSESLGVVNCFLGPMAAGAPPTTLFIVVQPSTPGTIVNRASVTHSMNDPNSSNNSAVATAMVPRWRNTGSLAVPRSGHTATLLQNGKVLVVGGEVGGGVLTETAELYDPVSGTWSAAAPLPVARGWHTATLLPSGEVLVAGGRTGPGTISLTDRYDPQTDTWTGTGLLAGDRQFHTATLLGDGRVLVAGGISTLMGLRQTAELYDPTSGSWSPAAGTMTAGRQHHTATLLTDGKVLLAGGVGESSAEVFDPATGFFGATPGMMTRTRDRHSATLLSNGRVLVAGGSGGVATAEIFDPPSGLWSPTGGMGGPHGAHTATLLPGGMVLVAGSEDAATAASSELYDPGAGSWSAGPPLVVRHSSHTATILPDGRVLLAGGLDTVATAAVGTVELYETTGAFTTTGSLGIPRYSHTTTLLPNGKVLAAGDGAASAPTELYDPATGLWTPTPSGLVTGRSGHTATLLVNGRVLVAGGRGAAVALAKAELFNPATSTWAATGDMNVAREGHTATLLPDGTALVAGGFSGACIPQYEVHRPLTGTWLLKGVMPSCRGQHAAVLLLNNKVLLIGGTQDGFGPLDTTVLYDPGTDTWTPQGNLARARQFPTATLLPNGKVLVAGGTSDPLTEIYDPTTGVWSPAGNLNAARANAAATLLPGGKVLVAGGIFSTTVRQSAEIFDPATLAWTLTGNLVTARHSHTAVFLPSGKVLIAGGVDAGGPPGLSSSELYDPGLGFSDAWRPVLASATPDPLVDSDTLLAAGTRFRGISEASGSQGAQDSSTDYPLVQLRRLDNDGVRWLPLDPSAGWTDGSFRSLPLLGLVPGEALVTVFTNGIPSVSRTVTVECPAATFNGTPGNQSVCPGSLVQFTVSVNGPSPVFQWRRNGIPLVDGGRITGAQTDTLQIANVDASDDGNYDVEVSLACSSVTTISAPPASLTVTTPLTSVTATPPGPLNVCQTTGCTAGPVVESHVGGDPVTHQWGFRTATGGPITDITGATSQSYTIQGTDFPGPGTYYVVVRTLSACGGTRLTSNEVVVIVDSAGVTDTVRYLTVTSKDSENTLEWLNPFGYGNVRIRYKTGAGSCAYPTAPNGSDGSLGPFDVSGTANEPNRFNHAALNNGDRYCYTVWVVTGAPFSAGKSIQGRPFPVPPGPGTKWGYNLGIFSMVPPGNGQGVIFAVANDGSLHSMVKGIPVSGEGGYWPGPLSSLPLWKPQSMNGPSQGRPAGVPVSVGGSTRTIFLSSQDGHVYAFNAQTGAAVWSPSSPLLAPSPSLVAHPSGVFTVFGGTRDLIFVGTRDPAGSKFYALRLVDGNKVAPGWEFDGVSAGLGKIGAINGQAAVDQDARRVYFASREFDASNNRTVWCLDFETGSPCWPAQAHGDIDTGVTMFNDRLYVGTHDGTNGAVKSIQASDGTLDWAFPLPIPEGAVKGYVAVDRLTGNSYFSTATTVWALDSAGSQRWNWPSLPSPSIPVYAPADLYVYVGAGDGRLHRLDVDLGTPVAGPTFPLQLGDGSAAVGSPTYDLAAGFVYVGTENGIVYAIQMP